MISAYSTLKDINRQPPNSTIQLKNPPLIKKST